MSQQKINIKTVKLNYNNEFEIKYKNLMIKYNQLKQKEMKYLTEIKTLNHTINDLETKMNTIQKELDQSKTEFDTLSNMFDSTFGGPILVDNGEYKEGFRQQISKKSAKEYRRKHNNRNGSRFPRRNSMGRSFVSKHESINVKHESVAAKHESVVASYKINSKHETINKINEYGPWVTVNNTKRNSLGTPTGYGVRINASVVSTKHETINKINEQRQVLYNGNIPVDTDTDSNSDSETEAELDNAIIDESIAMIDEYNSNIKSFERRVKLMQKRYVKLKKESKKMKKKIRNQTDTIQELRMENENNKTPGCVFYSFKLF